MKMKSFALRSDSPIKIEPSAAVAIAKNSSLQIARGICRLCLLKICTSIVRSASRDNGKRKRNKCVISHNV
jgi:hypothetical protein